jgi:hypothetical protein
MDIYALQSNSDGERRLFISDSALATLCQKYAACGVKMFVLCEEIALDWGFEDEMRRPDASRTIPEHFTYDEVITLVNSLKEMAGLVEKFGTEYVQIA